MRGRGIIATVVVVVAGLIGIGAGRGDPPTPHAERVASRGPIVGTYPMVDVDEQYTVDVDFYLTVVVPEQRAVDAYLAAHEAQRLADEAAAWAAAHPTPPPTPRSTATVTAAVPSGSCNGDFACFGPCTIAHESLNSGTYATNTGNGYSGAYQFDQQTWNNAVTNAGYPEYAGQPAYQAPPSVQDAAAAWLYSVAGNRPWGGRC